MKDSRLHNLHPSYILDETPVGGRRPSKERSRGFPWGYDADVMFVVAWAAAQADFGVPEKVAAYRTDVTDKCATTIPHD